MQAIERAVAAVSVTPAVLDLWAAAALTALSLVSLGGRRVVLTTARSPASLQRFLF